MQVEQSLCGEYINVQMPVRQADLLHSYLEYQTRHRLDQVEDLEHDVAQTLCDEIRAYLPDDRLGNYDEEAVRNFFNTL